MLSGTLPTHNGPAWRHKAPFHNQLIPRGVKGNERKDRDRHFAFPQALLPQPLHLFLLSTIIKHEDLTSTKCTGIKLN